MYSLDRRSFLRGGLLVAAGAGLTACSTTQAESKPAFVRPVSERVRAAEAARNPGAVHDFAVTAKRETVDLGGRMVTTWTYDGRLPGPLLRVDAGEVVRARLFNQLPADTTVHWHGLALRNDADGVPGVTQPAIKAGSEFTYEFTAPNPGTYWFHPHSGTQLDRGLYATLIVDDPREPMSYDQEWVVVLDDWLDDVTGTPDQVLAEVRKGMGGMSQSTSGTGEMDGMEGMDMGPPHARGPFPHAHGRHQPAARRRRG